MTLSVLEVEGYRYEQTEKKISTFFNGKYKDIESIGLGILLLYKTTCTNNCPTHAIRWVNPMEYFGTVEDVIPKRGKYQ
jgi:hypothetical protein